MTYFLEHPDKNGILTSARGGAVVQGFDPRVFAALSEEPKIVYVPMPDGLRGNISILHQRI